jgi:membrane-associated protein
MRGGLIGDLLDWIRPLFGSFGYLIVSVGTFLESAALTGLLVPGDVILALGGVYAGQGELVLAGVIACGAVAGILGETVGYLLGRRYGEGLVRNLPLIRRFRRRIDEARRSIEGNAGKTIVVGRFLTGAAGAIPFIAGASRVPPRTFFLYAVPTILVWSTTLALIGFFVGYHVETIDRILSTIGWFGLAIVAVVVGVWFWRRRRRR